jgi:hypothetical protein
VPSCATDRELVPASATIDPALSCKVKQEEYEAKGVFAFRLARVFTPCHIMSSPRPAQHKARRITAPSRAPALLGTEIGGHTIIARSGLRFDGVRNSSLFGQRDVVRRGYLGHARPGISEGGRNEDLMLLSLIFGPLRKILKCPWDGFHG